MVPRDDAEEYVHPVPFDGPPPTESPGGLQPETLVDSVLILLVLTVVQRMVGFVREILFCRWLDAEQLGKWDLGFGFLMLAAPLAVLSLPGTFPRYVERYRQGTNVILLDPDVAEKFPTSESVNEALRRLAAGGG